MDSWVRIRLGQKAPERIAPMSKYRQTEADVKRAVKGVIDGGGTFGSVEIKPDGSILVIAVATHNATVDDPSELRRLI
jgi:hypothetical protein